MLETTNLVICCIPAPHCRVVTARALGANGIDLIDEDDARGRVFEPSQAIVGCTPNPNMGPLWEIPI